MQDSPLVLTLSQLDEKYFKGLEAQESFRLHFQLHYEGSMELKGAADFDNAQPSAGGGRAGDKDASEDRAV
ncbi:hypothetical protein BFJ63_vAg19600 [Fusarium oxysporum f. sp. narcissi]|nr:hypothetical protein BFJ63_vAg19600 [Fusarium oxysporum f. sp. narcissi]